MWLLSAIFYKVEDYDILEVEEYEEHNLSRRSIGIMAEILQESTIRLPHVFDLDGNRKLYTIIEGRRTECYLCGSE